MSETIVAPAKRWIELHIDTIPIDGSEFREVQATDAYLAEVMVRFAQAHVQKALEAASVYGCLREDTFGPEDIINAYPLENVK